MSIELTTPSPDPDWQVIETARRVAQDVRWLVAKGRLTEEQAAPALVKLAEIIEEETALLK